MTKTYSYILIIGSIIGLLASFLLMLNTISLIENPQVDLPCNINPFISCSNAILQEQGQVFGFPNPLLGIVSFSMLLATGIMLAYGARAHKTYWQLVNLGLLASFVFVLWFIYQSLYVLGTLCVYCMVTWSVTWPLFLYTTVWNYREKHLLENPLLAYISKNHKNILPLFYIIVIVLIIWQFRDYFLY
ncbi:MAG: vitamin K epoxide reductase family protein [Patescibacteria group bacterium]